jgi:uncharacterized LabA/DUF88 family protein/cold shock CspA family protein
MESAPVKVGVYVDVVNLFRNGGRRMRYDVLREFAARGGAEPMRLNAYVSIDEARASEDRGYREGVEGFHAALRDFGYKVIEKQVKWFTNEAGERYAKANADLDMAVDALLQSENLDRVLMATGDGDFIQVVRALQNKGCRVEVVAFENVSSDLKREADMFLSGYLIPNLLPAEAGPEGKPPTWGEEGSRVRGTCHSFNQDKHYGFMRFLKGLAPGLWNTDTRHPDSPYASAFAHGSEFIDGFDVSALPSRDHLFEFTLASSEKGLQARNIVRIGARARNDYRTHDARPLPARAFAPSRADSRPDDLEPDEEGPNL